MPICRLLRNRNLKVLASIFVSMAAIRSTKNPTLQKALVTRPGAAAPAPRTKTLKIRFFVEGGVGLQCLAQLPASTASSAIAPAQICRKAFNGLDGDVSTFYGFVNVYYDVFTWGRLTPYVGGGVGFANHHINNISLPATVAEGESTDFAWNLQGGVEGGDDREPFARRRLPLHGLG